MRRKVDTRQREFGFPDEDLKTSLHDEIVLWLKDGAEQLTKSLLNWRDEWNEKDVRQKLDLSGSILAKRMVELKHSLTTAEHRLSEIQSSRLTMDSPASVSERIESLKHKIQKMNSWDQVGSAPRRELQVNPKLEVPIKRERYQSQDIIGYADVVFTFRMNLLMIEMHGLDMENSSWDRLIDWNIAPQWKSEWSKEKFIAFDAKGKIPSLGELVRQINTYKTYCSWPFYVVSPDDRFADEIASQNIGFIKYPEGVITRPKPPAF